MTDVENEEVDVAELLARINSNLELNPSEENSEEISKLDENSKEININITHQRELLSEEITKENEITTNNISDKGAQIDSNPQKKIPVEKKEKSVFTIVRDTPEEKEEIDELAKALEKIELVK